MTDQNNAFLAGLYSGARKNNDEVAEITEARVYPADYFKVSDWSCARTVE